MPENIPTAQNNPGDLKANGQIATYNSPAEGKAALYNDLTAKMTGKSTTGLTPDSSLVDFAKTYAPSSDGNNSLQYAANLANKMKVSPDTKIGTLLPRIDDFASAIESNEGYQGQTGQSQGQAQGQSTAVPSAQASTGTAAPQSLGQEALGIAGKVGNALFPVAGDVGGLINGTNTKTPLQITGDTLLSALPFIPGLGEAGEAARGVELAGEGAEAAKGVQVGSEIAAKTAPAAETAAPSVISPLLKSPIAKGIAMGYGSDVGTNLSQGKTGTSVLTPGLGTLTGGVLGVGEKALAGGGTKAAAGMVNSLVKPLLKDFAYGKNPGRAIAEEGITGNSLEDLANNIGTVRQKIGAKIGELGSNLPQMNLSFKDALSPIDDAMETAAKQNNTAVFNRLQGVKKALTENLGMGADETGAPAIISKGARNLDNQSYLDGQTLKQHVGDMTQWTGNASDDKAVNLALKKVYGGITQTMQDGIEKIPGIRHATLANLKALNERYGDLTSAEVATKYRDAVEGRQNLIGGKATLAGLGGGALTAMLTGNPLLAVAGTTAGTLGEKLLSSTAFKTRVAKTLAGSSKGLLDQGVRSPLKGILPSVLKTTAVRSASSLNK